MSLIGTLIKNGIELNQKLTFQTGKSAAELQEEELRKLMHKAKDTAFGKYYGFTTLLEAEDLIAVYQQTVPIYDYHQMHEDWWGQQQKFPDITWPGKPDFFALSSGTTGKFSKRIPITSDFIQSMRDVGTSMVKAIPNFDFPEHLFESEILMLSSSADLKRHEEGHLEGEISGINVSNFPDWYGMFYRPGKEIAAISDWDERIGRIAEEAPNWNIGVIAGIPSWVLLMLQTVIRKHGLKNIHEIWPNLTVYASGGVAFETYRKDFEAISGQPITIMDTYLASEGFFSYTARPGAMDMDLALSHGYFYEFVPFGAGGVNEYGELLEKPVSHTLDEVELDQDYVLIVSSCAGAWRYVIGDTIKFTSLDPIEIKITGRTKFFLNVVGSQLSEEKMDEAILSVSSSMNVRVNEYAVGAIKNESGDYIHQWVIVTDQNVEALQFANQLDEKLKDANKNYAVARSKALSGINVKVINKELYYDYLEITNQKGGQLKTPKVMSEEKMQSMIQFVESKLTVPSL